MFEAQKLSELLTMRQVSYFGPSPWCLRDYVTMEIEDQPPNLSNQFTQIIQVAGRRHAQSIQTLSLVIAAIVGAVAGLLASVIGRAF